MTNKNLTIRLNDHCEAFDYAFALWYWCTHHYSKFDAKHEAFCKITSDYGLTNIPDIDFDLEYGHPDYDEENGGAIMIYHELTEENWTEYFDAFCDYMDNEWHDDAC